MQTLHYLTLLPKPAGRRPFREALPSLPRGTIAPIPGRRDYDLKHCNLNDIIPRHACGLAGYNGEFAPTAWEGTLNRSLINTLDAKSFR